MRKQLVFPLTLLLLAGIAFPLSVPAQEEHKGLSLKGKKVGLIFNLSSLLVDIIDEHSDNVQGGLGLKMWLGQKTALRGICDFFHLRDSDLDVTDTTFGISAALEYHFLERRVSPYAGGIAGTRISTGTTNNLALYFGALLGAEIDIIENLALFGEYNLLLTVDEPQFAIDLGIGNNAQIGIIVYLN